MYVEVKKNSQNSAEFLKLESSVVRWSNRDFRYGKPLFIISLVTTGVAIASALAYLGYRFFIKKPADKKEVVT
jgi:hypothetical protein